jgi:hypothetical protein
MDGSLSAIEGDPAVGPAPWAETQAAMALFVVYPLILILSRLFTSLGMIFNWPPVLGRAIEVLLVTSFIALAAGVSIFALLKGFPRWTYPYAGMLLAIAATGLLAAGRALPAPPYGLPLAFAFLAGLAFLAGAFWQPMRPLLHSMGEDWTRLGFLVFGALPLAIRHVLGEFPAGLLVILAASLILAAGALATMRLEARLERALALLIAFTLAWAVAIVYPLDQISRGIAWPELPEAGRMLGEALAWLLLLLLPALAGAVARAARLSPSAR